MANDNNGKKGSLNLKSGLIFVRSKLSQEETCVSGVNISDIIPSCKKQDKWIVIAGNSYNVKSEGCSQELLQHDDEENIKGMAPMDCQDVLLSAEITPGVYILNQPLLQRNIVEMHLDSVLKDRTTELSPELFKCVNVRVLSLRHNNIARLPAEIGRMSRLQTLVLTENCLTFNTIPFTLTFCRELSELYLDHNLLDALPGFLLQMPKLQTVYRHGNHNYFKSTFMWYHTAERDRVMPLRPVRANVKSEGTLYQPESLQSHSVKSLIGAKINFFSPGLLPVTLQDHVAKVYTKYKICAYCSSAFNDSKTGFRVFTFKNPYLGNTCVPFEHWTCSRECGVALEEPSHKEEQAQARKLDWQYQLYINSIQNQQNTKPPDKRLSGCVLM